MFLWIPRIVSAQHPMAASFAYTSLPPRPLAQVWPRGLGCGTLLHLRCELLYLEY